MAECKTPAPILNTCCFQNRKILIYHPSNSKEGIAIKGTNLRVSFKYI